ncbi:hypothetical protein B0H13DRAFT_519476 [Mycena leptocephala]|nr:hypothetical protein B0H13DRAFT_519476 [Mycena leptocephala]
MDEFKQRLFINGWELTKSVWAVPQGFGNESYWPRYPTGREWVLESILGINHGGLGVVSWDDPTHADVKASASDLAKALTASMNSFIMSPTATINQITFPNGIDVGLWTVGSQTLVLATNINYENLTLSMAQLHLSGKVRQVLTAARVLVAMAAPCTLARLGLGGSS